MDILIGIIIGALIAWMTTQLLNRRYLLKKYHAMRRYESTRIGKLTHFGAGGKETVCWALYELDVNTFTNGDFALPRLSFHPKFCYGTFPDTPEGIAQVTELSIWRAECIKNDYKRSELWKLIDNGIKVPESDYPIDPVSPFELSYPFG